MRLRYMFAGLLFSLLLAMPFAAAQEQQSSESKSEMIEVKGCVKKGVEAGCLILTTSDGKNYSLHGKDLPTLDKKLVASVKGQTGGMDHCMQGTPLDVTSWSWTKMRCPKKSKDKMK